jgi:hypothetical protein
MDDPFLLKSNGPLAAWLSVSINTLPDTVVVTVVVPNANTEMTNKNNLWYYHVCCNDSKTVANNPTKWRT